tara:strand:+ start:1001 stop:1144 length:144 start_codon:yes stop_codon:yes gene_type:complete
LKTDDRQRIACQGESEIEDKVGRMERRIVKKKGECSEEERTVKKREQ